MIALSIASAVAFLAVFLMLVAAARRWRAQWCATASPVSGASIGLRVLHQTAAELAPMKKPDLRFTLHAPSGRRHLSRWRPSWLRSGLPLRAMPLAGVRGDWLYFNKDLGDLTDPYESRDGLLPTPPGSPQRKDR